MLTKYTIRGLFKSAGIIESLWSHIRFNNFTVLTFTESLQIEWSDDFPFGESKELFYADYEEIEDVKLDDDAFTVILKNGMKYIAPRKKDEPEVIPMDKDTLIIALRLCSFEKMELAIKNGELFEHKNSDIMVYVYDDGTVHFVQKGIGEVFVTDIDKITSVKDARDANIFFYFDGGYFRLTKNIQEMKNDT